MARQSLASKARPENAVVPTGSTVLASLLDGPTDSFVGGVGGNAYVDFASPKKKDWAMWSAAIPGLKEPDTVLIRGGVYPPVKLDPFKFHYLTGKQYWAEMNSVGEPVYVTFDPPERGSGLKEHIEACILAYGPDGALVPATIKAYTSKCPALKTAHDALQMAATPGWANLSPEHAESMAAPRPFMRFTATVTTRRRVSKYGDMAGTPYYSAESQIQPIGADESQALGDFFKDGAQVESLLTSLLHGFNRRLEHLISLSDHAKAA